MSNPDYLNSKFTAGGVFCSEMANLLLGKVLGMGESRIVYDCPILPDCVVKVEVGSRRFDNIFEHEVWTNYEYDDKLCDWLAPVVSISPCGIYLIQKKTEPVRSLSDLPRKIPRFFSDTKKENWGWFEDRIVAHDYANNKIFAGGQYDKMVDAEWWEMKKGAA